jgi:preprotein translocase subunit SecD
VLAVYLLVPTYTDSNYRKELSSMVGQDSLDYFLENETAIKEARIKRLKLGLDLQGGMRVVLEVDVVQLLQKIAKNIDDNFKQAFAEVEQQAKLTDIPVVDILREKFEARGLRLSRYYSSDIREENAIVVKQLSDETEKSIDRAMEIIRNRVDKYGVSEAGIQKQGSRRLIVELPGVSNEQEVRELLQSTALLEFKIVKDINRVVKVVENIDRLLAGRSIIDSTLNDKDAASAENSNDTETAIDSANLTDQEKLENFKKEHPFTALFAGQDPYSGDIIIPASNKARVTYLLSNPELEKVIPNDMQFFFAAKPRVVEGKEYFILLALSREPELTGSVITDARAYPDPQMTGGAVVSMKMNSEGAREWSRITGANVNKRCAIVLDQAVFSYPTIKTKISGGESQIDGMANMEEARLLEIVLKAGALPAPVDIIEQRTVGPSLGEDSIQKGLMSSLIAISAVIIFMLVYYRTGGITADFAVLINTLFILGVLAGFGGTLTLPGIAAIILTLGMSVDANVLIYERIREEVDSGKTIKVAIDNGYSKAFSAILDSNITTILTGIILYQFGTGPIQGFALNLIIGLTASFFSAIVITRLIIDILVERGIKVNFG